jgi:hypothetical protein
MSEIDDKTPRTLLQNVAKTVQGQVHQFVSGDAMVTVTVPTGIDATPAAGVWTGIPVPTNGRRVMNLKLHDAAGNWVTSFSQPFELRIRLTDVEVSRKTPVKVMYWDGNQWKEIEDSWVPSSAAKFSRRGGLQGAGTDLVVLLKQWPADPGIGVY